MYVLSIETKTEEKIIKGTFPCFNYLLQCLSLENQEEGRGEDFGRDEFGTRQK